MAILTLPAGIREFLGQDKKMLIGGDWVSGPRLSWRSRGPAGNLSQVPGNRSLRLRKVGKVGKVGKVLSA